MSFRFSSLPLEESALRAGLDDPACGGYAAFEGWVRDHNEGRRVRRLEYEAFEPLAIKEGERKAFILTYYPSYGTTEPPHCNAEEQLRQCEEEVQIVQLLGVPDGLTVITKIDMVEKDLTDIVEDEVRKLVVGTCLEGKPILSQNSMDAVSDRDFAAEYLFVCSLAGVHLSRLADDQVAFRLRETDPCHQDRCQHEENTNHLFHNLPPFECLLVRYAFYHCFFLE